MWRGEKEKGEMGDRKESWHAALLFESFSRVEKLSEAGRELNLFRVSGGIPSPSPTRRRHKPQADWSRDR